MVPRLVSRNMRAAATLVTIGTFIGASAQKPAIVKITSPSRLALPSKYAFLASFSGPPGKDELTVVAPPEANRLGCESLASMPSSRVIMVLRGKCTFVEKADRARDAGAAGVIIVNNETELMMIGGNATTYKDLFVAIVGNTSGLAILDYVRAHPDEPVRLTVTEYVPSPWDPSEGIVILMATSLVVAGAFFSTSDLRIGSPLAPKANEEVLDVTSDLAVYFCAIGSGMLLFLFFFMNWMIYVIIFAFCVGGFSCITSIVSTCLTYSLPKLNKRVCAVPEVGPITTADMLASVPAAAIVGLFFVYRNTSHGWIFQDIIGAGFLCWMQRTLRLPNIKVGTILLCMMFFFDIFWVFISPYLTPVTHGKSVMVTVAKGGTTGETVPMLLKIPAINDEFGHWRMLGFGDVALPGLLISYLRRHDMLGRRRCCEGYFVPAVIGYFVGLCVTIFALFAMQMAQPALLYLVPGTLGTTLVLGACRGEIQELWDGRPKPRGDGDSPKNGDSDNAGEGSEDEP